MKLTKLIPLPSHASNETRGVYSLAFGDYKDYHNEKEGYRCATEAFQTLMEYDLSTDEGEDVHLALETARFFITQCLEPNGVL